ncbi:HAMP domain-containing sensor histidine kinase [Streptomyces sp. NPDC051940]|uniref:sensor histidine kinase n=1 Tax=Streptomyces sp. NPDC051940 TaxID=3155675 RepID=UPI00343FAE44
MSLRNRVALAGGLAVLAALVLASLVLYPSLKAKLGQEHDSTLVAAAQQAPETLKNFKKKSDVTGQKPPFFAGKPVDVGSTKLQVLETPVVPGPHPYFLPVTATDQQVMEGTHEPYFRNTEFEGVHYRVYTARLPDAEMVVRVAMPMSVLSDPLNRLLALLISITAGGTVIAALTARLVAGRVLRPVRKLTETVEHITATQDLTAPIDARGRDEIARLARAFASLTAAVDASVTARRRLVADASHELRTPLTSLNTNLELLGEGLGVRDPQAPELVAAAREQTGELMALVGDLIDLARYGQSDTHTEDTRLDLLAERVARRAAARAPDVRIVTDLAECMVHGDPDALERAAANLLDNAVKWSPPGGRVTVSVTACGTLTVTDEGPGIPPADLPYVFDRFYRSPKARSRPGSGLGLAIVRQIAETHGGSIEAGAPPESSGTRLRLALPTASPPEPHPRPSGTEPARAR